MQHKIFSAESFVGSAISGTTLLSESVDPQGRPVAVREVVFREGNRRVIETVTQYPEMKIDFKQKDGSLVNNIISEGPDGGLWLTYTFEWVHEGASDSELAEKKVKEKAMAKEGVESTIRVIREMVLAGKLD